MVGEPTVMAKETEALVTKAELVTALNLPSVWAVDRLRKKKKIPFVSLGYRTVRYRVSEVSRALGRLESKEAGYDQE